MTLQPTLPVARAPLGYERAIALIRSRGDASRMYKRHVAALLWVAAAWYLGNAVVIAVGAPEVLSLPAGIAVGLVVWLDPTGRLWGRRPATHAPTPGVDPG